jgi:hypothetical protein
MRSRVGSSPYLVTIYFSFAPQHFFLHVLFPPYVHLISNLITCPPFFSSPIWRVPRSGSSIHGRAKSTETMFDRSFDEGVSTTGVIQVDETFRNKKFSVLQALPIGPLLPLFCDCTPSMFLNGVVWQRLFQQTMTRWVSVMRNGSLVHLFSPWRHLRHLILKHVA